VGEGVGGSGKREGLEERCFWLRIEVLARYEQADDFAFGCDNTSCIWSGDNKVGGEGMSGEGDGEDNV